MPLREVKLCLLGEMGVGKSSIVMRFVMDTFKPNHEMTIGASFMTKTLVAGENTFKFQIWDTAGQERYRALAPMYYRGAAAAIIVYDVTREVTFKAVKDWVKELRKNGSANLVLAIAGNKCDLTDLREVDQKDAKEYADRIGAIFTETSALTAVNIPQLFAEIANKLPVDELETYLKNRTQAGGMQLRGQSPTSTKKSGCCSRGGKTGNEGKTS